MSSLLLLGAKGPWFAPLWLVAVWVVLALAVLYAAAFLLRLAAPKVAAIAWTTGKEALSQPLFYVLLAIGLFALILFTYVPYNTFGEDIKVVKDQGLTLIMVLAVILALWTASISISDEIEGRTALTLLSKPVSRRQFILGKFLGIIAPVAFMFIILGALFLASVSYKVGYEAQETGTPAPTWNECRDEMLGIVPGLGLAFMEAVVLTSISVAIATRLPMLPNLIICAAIYVLGHLVPTLVNSAVGQLEYVVFVSHLLSAALPMLEHFNIYGAIAAGRDVPLQYLGVAAVYCALYTSVAMLLALVLFENRDLG